METQVAKPGVLPCHQASAPSQGTAPGHPRHPYHQKPPPQTSRSLLGKPHTSTTWIILVSGGCRFFAKVNFVLPCFDSSRCTLTNQGERLGPPCVKRCCIFSSFGRKLSQVLTQLPFHNHILSWKFLYMMLETAGYFKTIHFQTKPDSCTICHWNLQLLVDMASPGR